MTAILGAAACVIGTACGIGFGFNFRAGTAKPPLQTRFDPVLTCSVYLLGALACVVTVGVCLGVV